MQCSHGAPCGADSSHGAPARGAQVPHGPDHVAGRFGRMFSQLRPFAASFSALDELGQAMRDAKPADPSGDNPGVPAGFTYLGQFIDHDITFDPTALSEQPVDPLAIVNFRTPALELDSLYGLGPNVQPYLYDREQQGKLLVGRTVAGKVDPSVPAGLPNDLPRARQGAALIGDPRNDENLLVAQTHLAFLHFHNAVVDLLAAEGVPAESLFERAREIVRWHYQWIVVHDFLPRLTDGVALARVRTQGRRHYVFERQAYIPIEFSVAAYRIGHSMVREEYNHNRVFRRGGASPATLALLFQFTGMSGGIDGDMQPALPSDWIIDWRQFHEVQPAQNVTLNASRRIDPFLTPALHGLPKGGGNLAQRNLRRSVMMQVPSGQQVARALDVAPLSPEQIATGPDGVVARRHGFDRETPLWYYLLKEAEVQADGLRLGEAGSLILAEVFLGLLEGDPTSYLARSPNWTPTLPSAIPGQFTMADLLHLIGDLNPVG